MIGELCEYGSSVIRNREVTNEWECRVSTDGGYVAVRGAAAADGGGGGDDDYDYDDDDDDDDDDEMTGERAGGTCVMP
jgi:hypothetical protein